MLLSQEPYLEKEKLKLKDGDLRCVIDLIVSARRALRKDIELSKTHWQNEVYWRDQVAILKLQTAG